MCLLFPILLAFCIHSAMAVPIISSSSKFWKEKREWPVAWQNKYVLKFSIGTSLLLLQWNRIDGEYPEWLEYLLESKFVCIQLFLVVNFYVVDKEDNKMSRETKSPWFWSTVGFNPDNASSILVSLVSRFCLCSSFDNNGCGEDSFLYNFLYLLLENIEESIRKIRRRLFWR